MFPEWDFGKTEQDQLKAKAQRLKEEIQRSQEALNAQADLGQPLCQKTLNRLARIRQEQYELAQRL